MPSLDPIEPGLISRRFGSRRDGKQEVIEVWDLSVPTCIYHQLYSPGTPRLGRKFWIHNICADSIRLHETIDAEV